MHAPAPEPGTMGRLRSRVDRALGWLLASLMGLAVLNVLWQVFTRYVLRNPSSYTDELSRYLLIWIGLLGAGYAAGRRLHLAIDLLPTALTGDRARVLAVVIDAFVLLFALAVMVIGGLRLVVLMLQLEQTSAALGIPLGYVYLALPLSGSLVSFYAGSRIAEQLAALRGRQPEAGGSATDLPRR